MAIVDGYLSYCEKQSHFHVDAFSQSVEVLLSC